MSTILGFWFPSGYEWLIILGSALLIFGRRLPDVGRSLGRGIVEFKKGLRGIQDEVDEVKQLADETDENASPPPQIDNQQAEPQQPTAQSEREKPDLQA